MTHSTKPSPHEVEALLQRFMDGDTSLEEEQQLAAFFRQTDIVKSEWEAYKQMFAYFDAGMTITHKPTPVAHSRRRWLRLAAASLVALVAGIAVTLWPYKESPTAITKPQKPTVATVIPSSTTQVVISTTKEDKNTAVMMSTAPRNAKKAIKATKQPANNIHEELQKPLTKRPDDEVMEAMIEEVYANRKIAIIQAALVERGYEPVRQEDGSVTFQRATEPVITQEQEPINI